MTAIKKLPSQNYLIECVYYCPQTGKFIWKHRPLKHFIDRRQFNSWNKRFAGKEAFYSTGPQGHKHGYIDGTAWKAHRIAWKIMTGKEPPFLIDHKDMDPSNNCWFNLRDSTLSQNRINSKVSAGIHCLKNGNGWQAYVGIGCKLVHLGTFSSEYEAKEVRIAAVKKYYGEYAPCV